ncbi:MAG TPA: hypothetical protein VF834_10175 [Streptosporangiaceae bacterium]
MVTQTPAIGDSTDLRDQAARRAGLAVIGCYLLGALLVTWRLWADPASRIPAGNLTDADLFAWYLRYAAAAVSHGRLPDLVTSAMNAPAGVSMMWNTSLLLPGVLLAPVTLALGPQVSLTFMTTAGFAGSAAALFWVLRRWQVRTSAAALAGAVYGFSPALLTSAIGHYNLQLAILPPLIVDAGLRIACGAPEPLVTRRWASRVPAPLRGGIWLGVLVVAELFVSEELALITAITGLLLVAALAASRPRIALRRLGPAAAGVAVAASVGLALAGHALWTQFHGGLVQHGPLFPPDYYVNDVTGFVTPSSYLLLHTAGTAATAARYQGGATEYLAYLGWPLIIAVVLAAVACWTRPAGRAVAVTLVVLGVFSLGGHLLNGGTTDPAVTLPWHWLEEHQLLSSVLPDRLSIAVDGAAAVLLALGIDAARARIVPASRGAGRLVLAAAVLACVPLVPRPLAAASATPLPSGWSATFAALRLPAGARVLAVPVPTNLLTAVMRWQADTGQPDSIIGGYFIGPGAGGQAYLNGTGVRPTAWYLDQLWAAGLRPASPFATAALTAGLPVAGPGGPAPAGRAPSMTQVRADFAYWRPDVVVAVTRVGAPLCRYLTGLLGPPTTQNGDVIAWLRAKAR